MFIKAMLNMSKYQIPQYYQAQQVPAMAWTALVKWSMYNKLSEWDLGPFPQSNPKVSSSMSNNMLGRKPVQPDKGESRYKYE